MSDRTSTQADGVDRRHHSLRSFSAPGPSPQPTRDPRAAGWRTRSPNRRRSAPALMLTHRSRAGMRFSGSFSINLPIERYRNTAAGIPMPSKSSSATSPLASPARSTPSPPPPRPTVPTRPSRCRGPSAMASAPGFCSTPAHSIARRPPTARQFPRLFACHLAAPTLYVLPRVGSRRKEQPGRAHGGTPP